jgi:hypothetical protein
MGANRFSLFTAFWRLLPMMAILYPTAVTRENRVASAP